MKVLIATQEQYIPFIMDVIQPYDDTEHVIMMNFRKPTSDWTDYDVGISFMWQSKIQKHELEGRTWFNFHPGPLPDYKGRNLCYHAIMNGETEFGATIHYMDEDFDTGEIIEIARFPVSEQDTAETLSDVAIGMSKILFKKYFPKILMGAEFNRIPNVGGNYYPKMPIGDTLVCLDGEYSFNLNRFVRAVSYKDFHPKLIVGGQQYEIVKVQ